MQRIIDKKAKIRDEMKELRDMYIANECGNCGTKEGLQIHHIVPVTLGGSNNRGNICTMCNICHGLMHDITMMNLQEKSIFKKERMTRGRKPFGYRRWKSKLYRAHGYKIVRSIIELRILHKVGIRALIDGLDESGIESIYGKKWSHNQILYRILDNETYFGGEFVEEAVMEGSTVTWELVQEHNKMSKGKKRITYKNKDVEFVKQYLRENT